MSSAAWTSDRVSGHTLRYEGVDILATMLRNPHLKQRARCSCGETSPPLRSQAARKQWHREHKADIVLTTEEGQRDG